MNAASAYAMAFVLTCCVAGTALGAYLFERNATQMALYEVTRTDAPQAGEFVNATVIASGTAQAREAVAHMTGVIAKGAKRNVQAETIETRAVGVHVLAAYFDENEPAPADAPYDNGGILVPEGQMTFDAADTLSTV